MIRSLAGKNASKRPVRAIPWTFDPSFLEADSAKLTLLHGTRPRIAIACLGVLVAVCTAGIPDPRVPAPPQKEEESYPIHAELSNADIKNGQELNADQRSRMPDLSGECSEASSTLCENCTASLPLPPRKHIPGSNQTLVETSSAMAPLTPVTPSCRLGGEKDAQVRYLRGVGPRGNLANKGIFVRHSTCLNVSAN